VSKTATANYQFYSKPIGTSSLGKVGFKSDASGSTGRHCKSSTGIDDGGGVVDDGLVLDLGHFRFRWHK
jgi:hypothetical protein